MFKSCPQFRLVRNLPLSMHAFSLCYAFRLLLCNYVVCQCALFCRSPELNQFPVPPFLQGAPLLRLFLFASLFFLPMLRSIIVLLAAWAIPRLTLCSFAPRVATSMRAAASRATYAATVTCCRKKVRWPIQLGFTKRVSSSTRQAVVIAG